MIRTTGNSINLDVFCQVCALYLWLAAKVIAFQWVRVLSNIVNLSGFSKNTCRESVCVYVREWVDCKHKDATPNSHWRTEGGKSFVTVTSGTCMQVVCSSNRTFSMKNSIYFYTFLLFCSRHLINSPHNNSLSLVSNRADIHIIDVPVLMKNFPHLDSSRTCWLQGVQSTAENHTFLKMWRFFGDWWAFY